MVLTPDHVMSTPVVREIPGRLEPVTRDPFIDGLDARGYRPDDTGGGAVDAGMQ